ncbi:MAG: transposase [Azoarcus sp.]|nr:transposase [Azoarcus sp.]
MDTHLDSTNNVGGVGFVGRLEVLEGPTGRKVRSDDEKSRIVAESLERGAQVSAIARKYGVSRWQIYDWRHRLSGSGRRQLPGNVEAPSCTFARVVVDEPSRATARASIELVVGDVIVRTTPDVDDRHLLRVLRVAKAAAAQ